MKINRISPEKHKYLQILDCVAKPVDKLYFIGKLPETRLPSVAIVGTRKPTVYGTEVTERLASELAMHGIVIISGLAFGVDSIAHRAAIESGGITIAVLANGLPEVYPVKHCQLANEIINHDGAVISEYEPHSSARPYQFLERNRIVSGLADAIIITEAAARSGTLNTAMHALEQGKEVFVVPGNITSPMSSGCNALLKSGAIPVTDTTDILDVVAPSYKTVQPSLALGSTPLEVTILQYLQAGMRDGDELQATINCPTAELNATLTMMEINGFIRSLGANQWTLR